MHVNWEFPLSVFVTLLLKAAAIVAWATSITQRMKAVERAVDDHKDFNADMAAVETKVEGIEGRLVRMDEKLDRLIERR